MASKIGDEKRLVSTPSLLVALVALVAFVTSEDDVVYYPAIAITVGPAGNLKTPAKMPE